MSKIDSARRILETFKDGHSFLCLKDLAKNAGFKRASSLDFKTGFNYLVEKNVLKLQQSGWSSEDRGGKNHPKTVVLTANLYEVVDSEFYIDFEEVGKLHEFKLVGLQEQFKHKRLSEEQIKKYKKCSDCVRIPVVYITVDLIPVCSKHWNSLAKSNIEW